MYLEGFLVYFGADDRTRTYTSQDTRSYVWRGYQVRHIRKLVVANFSLAVQR